MAEQEECSVAVWKGVESKVEVNELGWTFARLAERLRSFADGGRRLTVSKYLPPERLQASSVRCS